MLYPSQPHLLIGHNFSAPDIPKRASPIRRQHGTHNSGLQKPSKIPTLGRAPLEGDKASANSRDSGWVGSQRIRKSPWDMRRFNWIHNDEYLTILGVLLGAPDARGQRHSNVSCPKVRFHARAFNKQSSGRATSPYTNRQNKGEIPTLHRSPRKKRD
eukprot:scaffold85704_cov37-Tisochrysis_lutea.AAC.2